LHVVRACATCSSLSLPPYGRCSRRRHRHRARQPTSRRCRCRATRCCGTVEADGLREIPELKGARVNRMRDESVAGVRVLDQTWESRGSYADAVRFYDRALADDLVIERDRADTATGWLVRLADGTVASITARNTQPATIEIQRLVP
jgi:hypothetical protein